MSKAFPLLTDDMVDSLCDNAFQQFCESVKNALVVACTASVLAKGGVQPRSIASQNARARIKQSIFNDEKLDKKLRLMLGSIDPMDFEQIMHAAVNNVDESLKGALLPREQMDGDSGSDSASAPSSTSVRLSTEGIHESKTESAQQIIPETESLLVQEVSDHQHCSANECSEWE